MTDRINDIKDAGLSRNPQIILAILQRRTENPYLASASPVLTKLIRTADRPQQHYNSTMIDDYLSICPNPEDTIKLLFISPPSVIFKDKVIKPVFNLSPASDAEIAIADLNLEPDTRLIPSMWQGTAEKYFALLKGYLRYFRLSDNLDPYERAQWSTNVLNALRAVDLRKNGIVQIPIKSHWSWTRDLLFKHKYDHRAANEVANTSGDLLVIAANTGQEEFDNTSKEAMAIRLARRIKFRADSRGLEEALGSLHVALDLPPEAEDSNQQYPHITEETAQQAVEVARRTLRTFGK